MVPVAVGHAAILGIVVEGAAAQHAGRVSGDPTDRSLRGRVSRRWCLLGKKIARRFAARH
jgi:hypothetical protein